MASLSAEILNHVCNKGWNLMYHHFVREKIRLYCPSYLVNFQFLLFTGGSNSAELYEEGPPYLSPNIYPTPPIISGKFPVCCDLSQTFCVSSGFTRSIEQNAAYPQIIRPIPRVFTPLCVSKESSDLVKPVTSGIYPQTMECMRIDKTCLDSRKCEEEWNFC